MSTASCMLDVGSDLPPALLALHGAVNGSLYELCCGDNHLGRHPSNHVVLSSAGVSRFHCTVSVAPDGVAISDRNSSNGTFVNQQRLVGRTPLRGGERISLGPLNFKYLSADDPERRTYDLLRRQADTDPLTNCFNKGYLGRALDAEFQRARLLDQPLAMLIFDLDHFKKLNDEHGHAAGDQVLQILAELVSRQVVRSGDTFARFGGEEFVVLLPSTRRDEAVQVAGRLCGSIAGHSFYYANRPLAVSVSVGVAMLDNAWESPSELFRAADQALYAAKSAGRNRLSVAPASAA